MEVAHSGCTRRHVLGAAAAWGMMSIVPTDAGVAAQEISPRRRIDVHHHFLPPSYMRQELDRLSNYRHGNMGRSQLLGWTAQQSIEAMDEAGVELALGSVSTPGVWYGDVNAARRLSREWNEAAARTVGDHPGRFGFFGLVAPPDIDGALAEATYVLDILRADGIGLLSNYEGKLLGDPAFVPLLEELNRRRAIIYVHPTVAPCCVGLVPGFTPQQFDFPLDTTRTIASLLSSGALARFAEIRWIFSHGAGTLPFLANRISAVTRVSKELAERNPRGVPYELKRLYCDIANAISPPQLAALTSYFPSTQLLYGSDFPFVAPKEEEAAFANYPLSAELRADIDRNNALRLFPRLRASRAR